MLFQVNTLLIAQQFLSDHADHHFQHWFCYVNSHDFVSRKGTLTRRDQGNKFGILTVTYFAIHVSWRRGVKSLPSSGC